MATNHLKLLSSNPITRTEVHCDGEDHITIVKPANPNDGYPNQVTSAPCTCTDEALTSHAQFEALGTPEVPIITPDCSSAHTFAGMIKHCTLKAGHTGLHDSGAQKWP
jgi:hypothetical protein